MAERGGFEPSMGYAPITVFETAAFSHSATSPHLVWGENREKMGKKQGLASVLDDL